MERLDTSTSFDDDRENKDSQSAHEAPLDEEYYLKVLSPNTSQPILDDTKDLRNVLLERKSKSMPARKCFRRISIPENKRLYTIPKYKDYQLLGDSQCVRFAEQILGMRSSPSSRIGYKSRSIGYCVSGQKIEDLESSLLRNNYKVHPKVIMMIGTNDIIQKTDTDRMCEKYQILLGKLIEKCSNIVLVTVPPVPKLEHDQDHWDRLTIFNNMICNMADKQIFVMDLCKLFITYNNRIATDYFEQMFHPGDRLDLIHLNKKGFDIMKGALDTYYFGRTGISFKE